MAIICCHCGDDIDAKYQDNMSNICGAPKCEDCYNAHKSDSKKLGYSSEEFEELSEVSSCCNAQIETLFEEKTDFCGRCGERCGVTYT